ncbi:MAG: peptidoglycan-binding protein [Bacteroidales bacterium]|nr:peptidoglycan-binding protein [Candidatus Equimonas faecalis]
MIITHVFSPTYWTVSFEGTPYNTNPKTALKAKDWAVKTGADVVYNLAFFNMSNYNTVNYVKGGYKDFGYGGVAERLTVSPGNVCGGYATGIRDNEVVIRGDGSTRTRNGIGITPKGNIIIAQSTSKVAEKNFCKEVAMQVNQYYKESVKLFLMEDGGGSTQMYSAISRLGISPEGGRKVPTVICVKRRTLPKFTRVLKVGCKGEDVRLLQMLLGGIECDGSYGNATKKRVKEAQKALGLTADGSAGPVTLKALGLY